MKNLPDLVSKVITFLTPFTWRRALALLAILIAVAVAMYLSGCHVQRDCRSFTTVKVDRIDTIEYNSRFHHDYKYKPYNH